MDRIQVFLSTVDVLALAVASSVSVVSYQLVDAAFQKKHGVLSSAVVVAAIALIFGIAQYSAGLLVNRCQGLRRLLMSDEFVEGTWIDISQVIADIGREIAIVNILYKDRQFQVSGQTYNTEDLQWIGNWESIITKYDPGLLYYLYRETSTRGAPAPVVGGGQLRFQRNPHGPVTYQASFFDPIHASSVALGFGYKLIKSSDLNSIHVGDEGRKHVLARFLRTHLKAAKSAPAGKP
jgi:hypothetical protein